jgi:hypothetical protein
VVADVLKTRFLLFCVKLASPTGHYIFDGGLFDIFEWMPVDEVKGRITWGSCREVKKCSMYF